MSGTPRDPRQPVRHRHGTEVHEHPGQVGFSIGGQVIADTFPDTDGHQHGGINILNGEPAPLGPPSQAAS
jgi:hypothetical protein